jgi:hypothetical protein
MANDSLSQRIFIAGGPGSGKTTLARRLSSALGLIHYELDRVFYGRDGGAPPSREALSAFAAQLATEDAWLAEGDYSDWVELLLERADVICLLDAGAPRAIWRCLTRTLAGWRRGGPQPPLWDFMRRCVAYYAVPGSVMHAGHPTERSDDLVASARFAHKVRRYRRGADVRFEPPPADVLARRRCHQSLVAAVAACLREHGSHDPWLWYDGADPHRGIYLALGADNGWTDRVVGTDLPDRTDLATGRRGPIPVGQTLAILTSRESALESAARRTASFGFRLSPIARRRIGCHDASFDVVVVEPVPAADAHVHPVPVHAMRARHGQVDRHGTGVRVVTPRGRWHYAAGLDVASVVPRDRADAVGYLRVRGALEAGPIGIGILAHDRGTFLARRAVSGAPGPIDVYLPVARVGDAASVVIQTWSEPSAGALTIAAMDIVCERDGPDG